VVRQAVDGLVHVQWEMGVDTGSMSGTYTTSSQLGRGTIASHWAANPLTMQFAFVRSDGMRISGQVTGIEPNIVVDLTGTADIRSASLTLTRLSSTPDRDNPHAGVADFHLRGWIFVQPWIGYAMVDTAGHVSSFGDMTHPGDAPTGTVAGMARTADPK